MGLQDKKKFTAFFASNEHTKILHTTINKQWYTYQTT